MDKKHTLTQKVFNILCLQPATRNSDLELWKVVCNDMNAIASNMPFNQVITHLYELGLPHLETIGRIRRKLQAEYPKLRATKEVEDMRYENFKRAQKYATEQVQIDESKLV